MCVLCDVRDVCVLCVCVCCVCNSSSTHLPHLHTRASQLHCLATATQDTCASQLHCTQTPHIYMRTRNTRVNLVTNTQALFRHKHTRPQGIKYHGQTSSCQHSIYLRWVKPSKSRTSLRAAHSLANLCRQPHRHTPACHQPGVPILI